MLRSITEGASPRIRVISDNDYAGDPDGLIQLAHLLLSPSADVRAIIGSHLRKDVPWPVAEYPATEAAQFSSELLSLAGLTYTVPVFAGAETGMSEDRKPMSNAAIDFIISEALRDDTDLPLYYLCGGPLTQIASAYLQEPKIAKRLKLVWIGGHGYEEVSELKEAEFNLAADIFAAQVIFNHSDIELWQVPESAYGTTLVSRAETIQRVANQGKMGEYIWAKYRNVDNFAKSIGLNFGEVFVYGDSPLVSLTVLQTAFSGLSTSSDSKLLSAPQITDSGAYKFGEEGREIRVFTSIDTRLMVEDFFTKLHFLASTEAGSKVSNGNLGKTGM